MKVKQHGQSLKFWTMPGSGAMGSINQSINQRRPLPICRQFDLPRNWETGQYLYFLTQHQATSTESSSNTRPDCGGVTPKVSGVFLQNQSVGQIIV